MGLYLGITYKSGKDDPTNTWCKSLGSVYDYFDEDDVGDQVYLYQ